MDKTFPRSEALHFGWRTAKENIKFFVVILLVLTVISYIFSTLDTAFDEDQVMLRFIVGIISWVVSSITSIGLIKIALNFVEKKSSKYADLFTHYDRTVNYMAGSILYGLIVGLGLILLIIPGIYLALRLQFFSYFVVEKNTGPVQALKASWEMTNGVTLKLLVYGLIVTGINILGALCLLIGLFWTVPTTQVATAYLFKHLSSKK